MKTIDCFLGDYYHDKAPTYGAINRVVKGLANVTLRDRTLEQLPDTLESNPTLIIIGLENRLNPQDAVADTWLTPELDKQLADYVASGGTLLVLHSGLASYPKDSLYTKMIGGYFVSHPDKHCQVRYVSNKSWPLANAVDYIVEDEFYIVKLDPRETTVFMKSESSQHGKQPAGWYHTFGRGRVMCLVPTHNPSGYEHPGIRQLFTDAISYLIS